MKIVLQRVTEASVTIEGQVVSQIGRGFLALLGVTDSDTEEVAEQLAKKMAKLRIFADSQGKTNLSAAEVDGELLVVSQFTLYADCKKGNRPSFTKAGSPAHAKALYEYFVECCQKQFAKVSTGEFGAEMAVSLVNDGPFTLILSSEEL